MQLRGMSAFALDLGEMTASAPLRCTKGDSLSGISLTEIDSPRCAKSKMPVCFSAEVSSFAQTPQWEIIY
jgi:hypothetical protein